MRWWAFWRRVWYGTGFLIFIGLVSGGVYYLYGYKEPTCFDGFMNGLERGIDCGGGCTRICSIDVAPPYVSWARSFRVSEGLYNAVAYVENRNVNAGTAHIEYTFRLFDADGLIVERKNRTQLPPNTLYPLFEGRLETGGRIPTQTVIEFEADPVWVNATLNTERFKTERRELKGADEKPVLTATLRNESLDEAKDVEVVATIFDSLGTALTTSRTKIPSFPGRSTRDVTFTWQEPIAKTLRSCEVPTDVALAIDLSGSMNDDGGTPPEPVSSVLSAAAAFARRLNETDQVSLLTYATEAKLDAPLTRDRESVALRIESLLIDPAEERGSTNIGEALNVATNELTSGRHNGDARRVVIVLTDGLATAPRENPEEYARAAASSTKTSGIEVFTIGLGENLNEAFLSELATDPTHYFRAPTVDTLTGIYETITGAICEEGAAVIDIIAKPTGIYEPFGLD